MTAYGLHFETVCTPSSERALCTPPDRKMTGSTGKIHGEIPVMRPPKKPMRARVSTVVLLDKSGSRRGIGEC
jgi:hypothetical protein